MSSSKRRPAHWSCSDAAARAGPVQRGCDRADGEAIAAHGPDPAWSRRARASGERGAATLIALALSALVVIAALVAADLGALAAARAQTQTAADLAALAAVTPAGAGSAVDRAAAVAQANGARMTRCQCQPTEAMVSVRRRVALTPFGVVVEVRAYARAVLANPDRRRAVTATKTTGTGTPSGCAGRFGSPVVRGDRASVEYWATVLDGQGEPATLAGCCMLRFTLDGTVSEARDYWHLQEGHSSPPSEWGRR
ncbi:MAG TPA: Rv3654c family TadE-like protein [Actinomycetes bacterium]|jgi:secretion/DNA translocation related TadE-like protein|nr:Rv3654c family TadE-like protein [Actinomycetes bacterium]